MKRKPDAKLFTYLFLFMRLNLLFMWCSFIFVANFLLGWIFFRIVSAVHHLTNTLNNIWTSFSMWDAENDYSTLQLTLLINSWRKTQLAARSIQVSFLWLLLYYFFCRCCFVVVLLFVLFLLFFSAKAVFSKGACPLRGT